MKRSTCNEVSIFTHVSSISSIRFTGAGCGSQQQQSADVAVNSYKIVSQNAQVDQTYTGTVKAENSVAVHARVTGYVVEKFVKGGDQVVAGQPFYIASILANMNPM